MKKTTILYKPKNQVEHKKVGAILWALPECEYGYIIEVKKNRPQRSLSQNAYMHVLLSYVAIYTGMFLDEVKDEFKKQHWYEMKVDKTGRPFKRLKSTSECSDQEMISVINLLQHWINETFPELVIPKAQDVTYKLWLEVKDQYEREFTI